MKTAPVEAIEGTLAARNASIQAVHRCISVLLLAGFILLLLNGGSQGVPIWLVIVPFLLLSGLDLATWIGQPGTARTARGIWGTVLFHALVIGTVVGGHHQMQAGAMRTTAPVEPQPAHTTSATPALSRAPSSVTPTKGKTGSPGFLERQPSPFPPRSSTGTPVKTVGPLPAGTLPPTAQPSLKNATSPSTGAPQPDDLTAAIKRAAELKAAQSPQKPPEPSPAAALPNSPASPSTLNPTSSSAPAPAIPPIKPGN